MEVEDGLARPAADVDDDPIVVEAGLVGDTGDELEHALRLVPLELADLAERVDMPLGDHEQMGLRLRVDVVDGDETLPREDVVAVAHEAAKEALVRQRESPPR